MANMEERLATALNEIEHLKYSHEENVRKIEAVETRLAAYDILAAKWGGMCMLAVGLGTIVIQFSDRIKAYMVAK